MKATAEVEVGPEGIEHLDGDAATPDAVAGTLSAMTLGIGRRFVIVEGVERWKDAEVTPELVGVVRGIDAATTTVAFVAMEDKRQQAPAALVAAVEKVGGALVKEEALKARDLPRWAKERAGQLGIELDGAAAQALVSHVGERRVRLERELEKLALEHGEGARLSTADVEAAVSDGAEQQVWGLVDAIVGGDRTGAVEAYLTLRAQGESLPRLTGLLQSRMRTALEIARRLDAGRTGDRSRRRCGCRRGSSTAGSPRRGTRASAPWPPRSTGSRDWSWRRAATPRWIPTRRRSGRSAP